MERETKVTGSEGNGRPQRDGAAPTTGMLEAATGALGGAALQRRLVQRKKGPDPVEGVDDRDLDPVLVGTITSATDPYVIVRSAADASSQPASGKVLSTGDRVAILENATGADKQPWQKVRSSRQKIEGWIPARNVSPDYLTPPVDPEAGVELPAELKALLHQSQPLTADQINHARDLIAQLSDGKAKRAAYELLQSKTPYGNQRASAVADKSAPDEMCNVTSLAMCLQYLGVPNPKPDMQYQDALETLRVELGLPKRTDPESWRKLAEALGVKARLVFAGEAVLTRRFWFETARPLLQGGQAVMFSIIGHVVRLQQVVPGGIVIDDPWGKIDVKSISQYANKWEQTNATEVGGASYGNDNTLPWEWVEHHTMRSMFAFGR